MKEAFTALLIEKSFSEITIRELTERANINRGTFYLHYLDKYDLLEKCEDEIFQRIEEIANSESVKKNLKLKQFFSSEQPLPFIINLMEYFKENAPLIKAILGPNGDPAFEDKLRKVIADAFLNNVSNIIGISKLSIPAELLAEYISSAHVGAIRYWLNTDMQQSPNEIATILFEIALKGPLEASGIKQHLK